MRESLIDPFGRRIDYLRVSVTDRCNYRCFYCIPPGGVEAAARSEFLSYEELSRLIGLFAGLGVSKVRFTGGEPLIRRDMVELVRQVAGLPGVRDLSLSTNAHLLERFAGDLYRAGIQRVNISLDTLDHATFARITGGGDLEQVLRGIDAALQAGMQPVKLNMVIMKGLNEHEIERMLDFALGRGADLRFIETMPVGRAGRQGSAAHYYPADKVLERIRDHCGKDLVPVKGSRGAGPASYYQIGGGPVRIGVISAISRHFCKGCNRVRLTARGDLVLCLGQEDTVPLGHGLRDGWNDEELVQKIREAIARKPERHQFGEGGDQVRFRDMSTIGG
ncbi:MAG TPA: GTP 3',8-cyclase MoaA [Gammaproteobacteria bacterium]|nr:GTP 3',8-cyclase MoaA [Gammaproteobacteria bacterium]